MENKSTWRKHSLPFKVQNIVKLHTANNAISKLKMMTTGKNICSTFQDLSALHYIPLHKNEPDDVCPEETQNNCTYVHSEHSHPWVYQGSKLGPVLSKQDLQGYSLR